MRLPELEKDGVRWEDQPLVPVRGCDTHNPVLDYLCEDCQRIFNRENPFWFGPYPGPYEE